MVEAEKPEEAPTLHDAEIEELESDDLVGLTLRDTYALTKHLGQGGMARVYEAQHTRIPAKRFAVKVLRVNMAEQAEIAARFEREAHAIASVVHPNIVDVTDVGTSPSGRPYIVTEFLEGNDLASMVDDGNRLDPLLATRIGRQVCRGIAAAHECGVIHRDLKPGNVFLSGDPDAPRAKVLDFGLARMMEAGDVSITRSGIAMGTPSYMSPEQARAESADQRSDVYGIGALLYVMLTGVPPYSEASPQETVLAVMAREPARPRSHAPNIPKRLEAIVQRAMARDPAERFTSATELEAELEEFERDTREAEARLSAPPPPSIRREEHARATEHDRTRLIFVAALGAALLSLWLAMAIRGGLAVFVLHRAPTASELALMALAILGTVATPAILSLRYLRRKVWHNSARVAELLARTRAVVYSAIVAYGLAALAIRAHDTWLQRGAKPESGAWAGWDVLLCSVAMLVGGAAALRGNLLAKRPGRMKRFLAGPVVAVATLAGVVALMRIGFLHSAGASPESQLPPTPRGLEASKAPTEATAAPIDLDLASAAAVASAEPAPDAGVSNKRASITELDAAKERGLEGWRALAERYPRDPHVLEPLALAYGEKKANQPLALNTLVRLFKLDRVTAKKAKVRALLVKLAFSDRVGERALQVMAHEMGAAGPDLLYDLYVTAPLVRDRARALLLEPGTRERATPALLIAFDVRSASSCKARLPLLTRAKAVGDKRVVATLVMLSNRTRKGCGYRKRRPCPPPCGKQAAAFREAINHIQARLKK